MTKRLRTAMAGTILVAWFCASPSASGQFSHPKVAAPNISIVPHDPVELVIPAEDGQIVWKDVADALADALTLDAATVEQMLPSGSLEMRSEFVVLAVLGINIACGDKLSIDVLRDDLDQPALRLRCRRDVFAGNATSKPATMAVDEDWRERTVDRPLVICIHGLRSEPAAFDELRDYLRQAGYATAAAGFDDEQSIALSAQQLSQISESLFASEPAERPGIALVGHSMGGLVAREWTENDQLFSQPITTLITIGTPHGGSSWASMPPLLNLVWKGDFDRSDLVDVILHQPSAAGLRDLAPGSQLLQKMDARPRRADVRYTTIVGTGSLVTEQQVADISHRLRSLDRKSKTFRLLRPRLQPLVDGIDELARGKGDGAVAARRATLAGVDDEIHFELSHGELIRPPFNGGEPIVFETILNRLDRRPH